MLDLVVEYGGANSSEHGDGLARSEFNRRVFGDELYGAMRAVKRLFDPDGRMNPGKIVDAPAMTEHLRDPAMNPAPAVATRLSFPEGMRAAADRCMNIGLCRKTASGVMCPSYMATRDEEHATRGRANALVMALSAPDPRAALGHDRLHGILDLCLECKACKRECPLGVDMAALKAETLAVSHDLHGVPTRARLFAAVRRLNALGSALAPLSNLPGRSRLTRTLAERVLGVAAARPLPRFRRDTLLRWLASRRALPAVPARRGRVPGRLVPPGPDRHRSQRSSCWSWPAGGCASSRAAAAAGQASRGLLDRAGELAARMSARLAPFAERGVPIVGVEPSCLLTLRDSTSRCIQRTRRPRRWPAPRAWSRSCSPRRSTTAG